MADVGIVMPVYKQDPEYLRKALHSILHQTYSNYRFVIVVDGAPSETIEMIKETIKKDNRVKIIVKKVNRGVPTALNFGFEFLFKKEDVKYLTWVSSDNIYYENYIERLREALVSSSQSVGLVYSAFRHIDENGNYLTNVAIKKFQKYQEQPKENLLDVCFIGISFMYRKNYAIKVGRYEMAPVEDYDYWLRLTEHCDIKYVPEVLMEYRKNSPHSVSATLNSITEHRKYRNVLQLTKYRARSRRKIPVELTILFPVADASKEVIERLEALLEQSYSNFTLIVLDVSEHSNVAKNLNKIPDPRTHFLTHPNLSINQSIEAVLEEVTTPFLLICTKEGSFPSNQFVLYRMVSLFKHVKPNNIVSVQDQDGQASIRNTPVINEITLNELYKTKDVRDFFKRGENDGASKNTH